MTSQEKKAWLGRYRQLDQRIGQLAEEISLWRSRAQKITPSYEGQPRGGGEDRLQSAVEMILQLEEEADREIDALVELKGEIRRAIRTVEDHTLRVLLSKQAMVSQYHPMINCMCRNGQTRCLLRAIGYTSFLSLESLASDWCGLFSCPNKLGLPAGGQSQAPEHTGLSKQLAAMSRIWP